VAHRDLLEVTVPVVRPALMVHLGHPAWRDLLEPLVQVVRLVRPAPLVGDHQGQVAHQVRGQAVRVELPGRVLPELGHLVRQELPEVLERQAVLVRMVVQEPADQKDLTVRVAVRAVVEHTERREQAAHLVVQGRDWEHQEPLPF